MDLSNKSKENIIYMIDGIKEKLKVVNAGAIKGDAYDVDYYEDIHDIYQMVMTKENISIREIDAIISELSKMRSK